MSRQRRSSVSWCRLGGTLLDADYSCIDDAQLSSGRLFTRDGRVYDATNADLVKRIGVETGMTGEVQDVAVDPVLRRVYVLHSLGTDEAGDSRISAYDLDSLAPLGSVVLRQAGTPDRMIRWGEHGLAVSNRNGKMLLLEGAIVDGT